MSQAQPKTWSDISIQVPQPVPASNANPFKNLQATANKINLQAELSKFATAAQLGKFTYSFGTLVSEKSTTIDVVCVNCEKSFTATTPLSGWVLVSGTQWKFTAPTKEVIDVYFSPLDKVTPLGKVGECLLLQRDGSSEGMTQGIIVTQTMTKPGAPNAVQHWAVIPGHGLKGNPATRKVSCCAGDACMACYAGDCISRCLGNGHAPTAKKLLASGDKQITVNPGDFDLAAYQVKLTDIAPLDVSDGLLKLVKQDPPQGVQFNPNYKAAVEVLRSVADVGTHLTVQQLRDVTKANEGRPLVVFKKGMTTGWTTGRILMIQDEKITLTPFENELLAGSGDCGSPCFVVEPANESNGGKARARLIGYVYAAALQGSNNVQVAPLEAATDVLRNLVPGAYAVTPAHTYYWGRPEVHGTTNVPIIQDYYFHYEPQVTGTTNVQIINDHFKAKEA